MQSLKTVFHEPFSHKLLTKLPLWLSCFLQFGVRIRIKKPATVWRMHFVNQVNVVIVQAKFVLGIYENKSLGSGKVGTLLKQFERNIG